MTPSFTPKAAAIGVACTAILIAVFLRWSLAAPGTGPDPAQHRQGSPGESATGAPAGGSPDRALRPQDGPRPLEAAAEPIESAPATTLLPGHFGGVSVRHDPEATAEAAAASPPGSEEVITTASGKKLLRVTTDGRFDAQLAPPLPK